MIQDELANVPGSYYSSDDESNSSSGGGGDDSLAEIVARLARLEMSKSETVAVQTKDGKKLPVGEVAVQEADRAQLKANMIEEWFDSELKRRSTAPAGAELGQQLSLFKAMGSARQI